MNHATCLPCSGNLMYQKPCSGCPRSLVAFLFVTIHHDYLNSVKQPNLAIITLAFLARDFNRQEKRKYRFQKKIKRN